MVSDARTPGPADRGAVTIPAVVTPHSVRRWLWVALQIGVAATVLVLLGIHLGGTPIHDALHSLSWWAVFGAVLAAAMSTAFAAYRWRLVTIALDVPISYPEALASYYTAQLLNSTLPGGVLGDVNRGIKHGHATDALARSMRSVVWDRVLGQCVQSTLTVLAVLVIASPLRPSWQVSMLIVAAAVVAVAIGARAWRRRRLDVPHSRFVTTVLADIAAISRLPRAGIRIASASLGVVAGYVVIFVIAAYSVDAHLSAVTVVWMAMVVLLIGAIPLNVAGWGPREGAAVWVFTIAGPGSAQGLAVSIVYGLLALAGTLPGVITLIAHPRTARRA